MDSLRVEVAENGFVVYEGDSKMQGMIGKLWAFESPLSLAKFMQKWGDGNTKVGDCQPETVG